MIIKNGIIASNIMTALLDHDNRFFDESTERIDFSNVIEHDDESLELPDETLNKIRNLRVNISTRNTSQEEINDALDALGKVLDVMHLEYIHISPIGKGAPIPIDLSCLKHLNTDIENISLRNVDLSQEKPEMFDRFDSLKYVSLEKCNISNPAIVSTLGKKVRVSLKENSIAPEYFMDTVKLIQNSEAGFVFSGVELETIANAYKFKRITLSDYLKLKDTVDLSIIPNLKVSNDKDIDVEKAPEILEVLNSAENIMFECDINNLRILDPEFKLKTQTSAVIKNASDLTAEELEKRESVYSVRMEDGQNTWEQQGEPYTRDEYIAVRKEIDKIIESVEFPDEHDPDRDKKVFAQIYKALGKKISYDYYAISKEGRKDKRLDITCRNLIGGLLEDKAVCAGYADILRNTLACVGIHSEYAGANVDIEGGVPLDLSDPGGHAWNKVFIDLNSEDSLPGKYYFVDITWTEIVSSYGEELSHTYFGLSDEDVKETHFAFTGRKDKYSKYAASENLRYYDSFEYSYQDTDYDLVIENTDELTAMFDYLFVSNRPTMEIVIDYDYMVSEYEKVNGSNSYRASNKVEREYYDSAKTLLKTEYSYANDTLTVYSWQATDIWQTNYVLSDKQVYNNYKLRTTFQTEVMKKVKFQEQYLFITDDNSIMEYSDNGDYGLLYIMSQNLLIDSDGEIEHLVNSIIEKSVTGVFELYVKDSILNTGSGDTSVEKIITLFYDYLLTSPYDITFELIKDNYTVDSSLNTSIFRMTIVEK